MSENSTTTPAHTTEKTFRSYTQDEGKGYAQTRRDYDASVYRRVLDQHTTTGGQLDTLLDVGCGPGLAARGLAANFAHVIGVDPAEGMIAAARSLAKVKTAAGEEIRYEIGSAEDLGGVPEHSVDLITAANAAHWFDMARFWKAAARVLKPGGSVALWTGGPITVDPSTPNAAAIQAVVDEFEERDLKPYWEAGNYLVRDRYKSLAMPWTLEPPVQDFDQTSFFRKEWSLDEVFFMGLQESNLDDYEKMMSTGSHIIRWRKAHPDAVGTERDIVRMQRRQFERLLHEAGVPPGQEKIKGNVAGAVLVVKKNA